MKIFEPKTLPDEGLIVAPAGQIACAAQAKVFDGTTGRLIAALREIAQDQDPVAALTASAKAFIANDPVLGNAFADLAVTGHNSRMAYDRSNSLAADVADQVGDHPAETTMALERAALVRSYLAMNGSAREDKRALELSLRDYIAVSGEDDPPSLPVNIAPTQNGAQDHCFIETRLANPLPTSATFAPPHQPRRLRIRYASWGEPDAERIILFVHGHGSLIEEIDGIADQLMAQKKGALRILALDLPSCGYSEHVDPIVVRAFYEEIAAIRDPALRFYEECVCAFVRELGLEEKKICIAGGSLGGNLSLRLSCRTDLPWRSRTAAWSAACLWDPLEGAWFKDWGVEVLRPRLSITENAGARAEFMKQVFDDPIVLAKGLKSSTQPEMWYADGWPPKKQFIAAARGVREEVYTDYYRRFCWRVAFEQLVMSFRVTSNDANAPHRAIQAPVLVASGADDNYNWANIYARTRDLADRLNERGVDGAAYLLAATGHSIHDERPKFFAARLLEFLES